MNSLNFQEWLAHWGEERLTQQISDSQQCYRAMWERRNDRDSLHLSPAWELSLSLFWEENTDEWHARWTRCGGTLYEGRMIAAKRDGIWDRLSGTFYDGLGNPYPPYARSSCARWDEIGRDEAIALGVIGSNDGLEAYRASLVADLFDGHPERATLADLKSTRQQILAALAEMKQGEEHVAHERQQQREQAERVKAEYEAKNQQAGKDWAEKNAMFRLLEEVERSLREAPVVHDERRWNWLCDALAKLTATPYFDEYPNWRPGLGCFRNDVWFHRSSNG